MCRGRPYRGGGAGPTSSAWPSIQGHGDRRVRRIYEPLTTGRNHVCAFLVLHALGRYKPLGVFNMRQTSWPRPFRGEYLFQTIIQVRSYVATYSTLTPREFIITALWSYRGSVPYRLSRTTTPWPCYATPCHAICTTRRESVVYQPYNRSRGTTRRDGLMVKFCTVSRSFLRSFHEAHQLGGILPC